MNKLVNWLDHHPLGMCGFRPFFLATAIYAVVLMLLWLGFLAGLISLPIQIQNPIVWHMHEWLFGLATATMIGFLLTAVHEFTGAPCVNYRPLWLLVAVWLGARVSFWWLDTFGLVTNMILNGALFILLIYHMLPPIWQRSRQQLSFIYVLLAFALLQQGFFVALMQGETGMNWLYAVIGVWMVLIVVALSRVSMQLFNVILNEQPHLETVYLARPPRRNLAISMISLYTAISFFYPQHPVAGWIALAASAAMLNLLNDWHVGRALWNRWLLMLYAVYWFVALGYGVLGLGILMELAWQSAGHHLLVVGALSLAMLTVMMIAGRQHAGYNISYAPWTLWVVGLIMLAVLTRFIASAIPSLFSQWWLLSSALLWLFAFVLYGIYSWRSLTTSRPDLGRDCDERIG